MNLKVSKDTNKEAQEPDCSLQAANNNGVMASLVTESQPFKSGILDTLESQPFINHKQNMNPGGFESLQQFGGAYANENQPNQSLLPDVHNMHIQPQNMMQPSQISNAMPIRNGQNPATSLKVVFNWQGEKQMIKDKDMPIKYQNNDPNSGNILLKPILDYIKYLGKQISNQSISYFSEEDEVDVFIGIEGASIDEFKTIPVEEMGHGPALKLILNIKPPQDAKQTIPQQYSQPAQPVRNQKQNNVAEEEMFAVSQPDLNTGTQVERAVGNIIGTIKRDRSTRAEMDAKNQNVSENVKINQKTAEDIQMKNFDKTQIKEDFTKAEGAPDAEDHLDSNPENNEIDDAASSGNEENENDDDGSYDSNDKSRNASAAKRQKLNNFKKAGVLQGRDKKAVNAQSSISTIKKPTPQTSLVKTGPVSTDDGLKKRTKERTITEIIEKVSTWRKLYNGVMIPNKETKEVQLQRWSLEDAAKKVNVSKKSLDDYLLQLRFGKKFGFDFEKHRESKVGVLRSFVKDEKDKLKKSNGNQKISSKSQLKDE